MGVLRKLIAITLLAIFGLPFASALFAMTPKSEVNLPACCRKNGKHHCIMSMAERNQLFRDAHAFLAPPVKCPYCPSAISSIRPSVGLMPPTSRTVYAGLISHPAVVVQIECKRRIARDRAHGKRGPPISLL